jgi:hypothetical protein
MRGIRNVYNILVVDRDGDTPLERARCVPIWDHIMKHTFKKLVVRLWTGFGWLMIGTGGGLL